MSSNQSNTVIPRLSVMMFLQYAVWGLWLPVLSRYLQAKPDTGGLGFTADQVGYIVGSAASVGAVTAPFIGGQLADRYFRSERFLSFLLLTGGIIQIILAQQLNFVPFLVLAVLYSVLYMPTLSLTNGIAFANLSDSSKQFPKVRIWGTIGWIAASWLFTMFWLQSDLKLSALPPFLVGDERKDVVSRLKDALTISGALSVVYAGFCLLLPATPPKKDNVESLAFAKAFALLKKPSVLVLVVAALFISMIHQVYFMQTGQFLPTRGLKDSLIGPAMTIGQFAEIAVMMCLGFFLSKLGFKWTIALGAFAYFVRYLIWSMPTAPLWLIVSSMAFHGFCYACFFAGTYIYVDKIAPSDIRNSAQTVIGIIILGLGPVLASAVFPYVRVLTGGEGENIYYPGLWKFFAFTGLAVSIFVAVFFKEEKQPKSIEN